MRVLVPDADGIVFGLRVAVIPWLAVAAGIVIPSLTRLFSPANGVIVIVLVPVAPAAIASGLDDEPPGFTLIV